MKYFLFLFVFIMFTSYAYSFLNNKVNIDNYSKNVYDYSINLINGEQLNIKSFKGKKIIIVNVASKCGYTPQYDELQKLYTQYGDQVEIIGFPANDFLWQEPGKNEDIQTFCKVNYGVTFPIVQKSVVKKNKNQHPLFSWLTHKELNGWNNSSPGWNFYKYLIDDKGELVNVFSSKVKPLSSEIISFITNKSSDNNE